MDGVTVLCRCFRRYLVRGESNFSDHASADQKKKIGPSDFGTDTPCLCRLCLRMQFILCGFTTIDDREEITLRNSNYYLACQ